MQHLTDLLDQGLGELGLTIEAEQKAKLLQFTALIEKWNKAFNLTSVRDAEQMVIRHLLDSLAIFHFLPSQPQRILDVGCGAGIPGIPLSIVQNEYQWHLVDSNSKKTRFVRQAIAELALPNVEVSHDRVETLQLPIPAEALCCRAFSETKNILQWCHHLVMDGGVFYLMKSANFTAELNDLPAGFELIESNEVKVPLLNEQRFLVSIKKTTESD